MASTVYERENCGANKALVAEFRTYKNKKNLILKSKNKKIPLRVSFLITRSPDLRTYIQNKTNTKPVDDTGPVHVSAK